MMMTSVFMLSFCKGAKRPVNQSERKVVEKQKSKSRNSTEEPHLLPGPFRKLSAFPEGSECRGQTPKASLKKSAEWGSNEKKRRLSHGSANRSV